MLLPIVVNKRTIVGVLVLHLVIGNTRRKEKKNKERSYSDRGFVSIRGGTVFGRTTVVAEPQTAEKMSCHC